MAINCAAVVVFPIISFIFFVSASHFHNDCRMKGPLLLSHTVFSVLQGETIDVSFPEM